MKITKRQLRRIIKEEKMKVLSEITPADMGMAAAKMDDDLRKKMQRVGEHGAFNQEYWSDIIRDEIMDHLGAVGANYLDPGEAKSIERMINAAANSVVMDLVEN